MSEETHDEQSAPSGSPNIKTMEEEFDNFLGKSKNFEKALEEYLAKLNGDNSFN